MARVKVLVNRIENLGRLERTGDMAHTNSPPTLSRLRALTVKRGGQTLQAIIREAGFGQDSAT
jgi:hypothetical protein